MTDDCQNENPKPPAPAAKRKTPSMNDAERLDDLTVPQLKKLLSWIDGSDLYEEFAQEIRAIISVKTKKPSSALDIQ